MMDTEADIVEHASPLPFRSTIEKLVESIERAGMMIIARIDHAENARNGGTASGT